MEKSYYEILGVAKTATKNELTKAKRELSKKYHPDKLPPNQREYGTKMIQQINEAYDILSDDEKRPIYDRFGKDGLDGHMPQGHPFSGFGGFGGFDPFGQMPFNMGHNMHNMHNKHQKKTNTIEIIIDLTLEEVFNGKDINNIIKRSSPCTDCNLTGFVDKKHHKCDKCKGSGQCIETVKMGQMIMKQVGICNKCNGTGNFSDHVKKCNKCNGQRIFKEEYTLNYKLEKGIVKGTNRGGLIENEGNYDIDTSKRGHILIVTQIMEHKVFKIKNTFDLKMKMELTLAEAICGTTKKIKFLDGKDIYIDISYPLNNGDTTVMNGFGLPEKFSTYKSGKLYVEFKVILPDIITDTSVEKIYSALTGETYNYDKLHSVPDGARLVEVHDLCDSDESNSGDSNDNDNDEPHDGNVQCAQQ